MPATVVAIAPLRALRYDPDNVDMQRVTSPPYDVISKAERDGFLAEDERNIIAVILGPGHDGDQEPPKEPNRYTRARDHLAAWQTDGAMVREGAPALYYYEIQHDRGTMQGFFARLRVDVDYQSVKRHEKTLAKPKADRLHLLTTTDCDTEPIQVLYRDERGWVDEVLQSNALELVADITDEQGMRHRVWRIDRGEAIAEVVAQLADRDVVIADGHHRYQTSVHRYQQTGRDEDGSILAVFVRDTHPGITIDPTHRLIYDITPGACDWDSQEIPFTDPDDIVASLDADACALVTKELLDRGVVRRLTYTGPAATDRLSGLSVTRVHDHLFPQWGLTYDNLEDHVTYTRDNADAFDAVAQGRAHAAVLVAPVPVDSVLDVAQDGHVMPQKSTYFIPKMRSGLILSPRDEPLPRTEEEEMAAVGAGKPDFQGAPLGQ